MKISSISAMISNTHFMLEMYQQQQLQQLQSDQPTNQPDRSQHKRTRPEEEKEMEEKTTMVDDEKELAPGVTAATAMSSTVVDAVQPIAKKAKLRLNGNESKQDGRADHTQIELASQMSTTYLSPFNSDAIPALLDAAMELGDAALCHQLLTLLCMQTPLNMNSRSLIYGDTIGMRLFHLLRLCRSVVNDGDDSESDDDNPHDRFCCSRFRDNHRFYDEKFVAVSALIGMSESRKIDELMINTIDPRITNSQGQTMLHVIAATTYSLHPDEPESTICNHLQRLSKQLILALIQRGADLLARDAAGNVAIIELARIHLLVDLSFEEFIFIVKDHDNPVELLNVANRDGTTLLRVCGFKVVDYLVMDHDEDKRNLFPQINFSDPEFGLAELQAENDALRHTFLRNHFQRYYQLPINVLATEIQRYEQVQKAINDCIKIHRPTRRSMLEPFLIPVLANIVTDYWIGGGASRPPTILLSVQEDGRVNQYGEPSFSVVELTSSERTLESLRTKISSLDFHIQITFDSFNLQVGEKLIETDEDVQALRTGEQIDIKYLFNDDEVSEAEAMEEDTQPGPAFGLVVDF